MGTAQFQLPNSGTDLGSTYKSKLEGNAIVEQQIVSGFQVYANNPVAMNVKVAAGSLMGGNGFICTQGIQTSGTITAPVGNPRIDLVVLEPSTGVVSTVPGAENVSPVPPAVPFGKLVIAQISLTVGMVSITNTAITDMRQLIQLAQKVSKRQCALSGALDANGRANFITAGTGLNGTLLATAKPLALAFALGYSAIGDLDLVSIVQADMTNGFASLPPNTTNYLHATYVNGSTVTLGSTLAPFQWGDTYLQNRQSVLQFGGTAGSTTFLDDYGNTWAAQGGAKVQTNQFKFGTGGLGGGGASNILNGTTDYIKSTGFTTLGDRGWTMRAWVYMTSLPTSGNVGEIISLAAAGAGGAAVGARLMCYNNAGVIKFAYILSSNGTNGDLANLKIGTTTPAINTWYFVELTHDFLGYGVTGAFRLYINGVQESVTSDLNSHVCALQGASIGARFDGNAATFLTGYIDKPEILPYCNHPNGTTYSVPTGAPNILAAGYSSDWFSTADGKMYQVSAPSGSAGANPTFTQIARVYLGEQDTGAAAVSATRNYAYRGIFKGSPTSPLPNGGTKTTVNHNIGVKPSKVELVLENLTADGAWVPGDLLRQVSTYNGTTVMPISMQTIYNSMWFGLLATPFVQTGSGVVSTITASSWAYRVNCERDF